MISVIIPTYNCEKTVEQTLRSVLAQKYDDFEVLVIDDGSSDNTLDVVSAIAAYDPKLKVIAKENGGVSSARNLGIREAKGEYICFVDSDDTVAPDYLNALIDGYAKGALSVVNFCRNNGEESVLPVCKGYFIEDSLSCITDYLTGELGTAIGFCVWNKLFCKQIITDRDIKFDTSLKMGEDLLFVLEYLCGCSSVSMDPRPLYSYTYREDSAVNSAATDFAPRYELLYNALEAFIAKHNTDNSDILGRWSNSILFYVLLTGYVSNMSYRALRDYHRALRQYRFINACASAPAMGIKQKLLRQSVRSGSAFILYMLVRILLFKKNLSKGSKTDE